MLDGGAYRSSSFHVTANAACFSAGPYRVPNAHVEAFGVRTNNPPCGAMRGFGAVQVAFAHEAQMDRLAAACGVDPIELRLRNALAPGDELLTGQRIDGYACRWRRSSVRVRSFPCPRHALDDLLARPGGAGRTSDAVDVRRGVGFAVGFKNLMYAEGYDDSSIARCHLLDGVATITCAAAEVGQGFVTLAQQFARTILGVDDAIVAPADTSIGSAGSTSASRQTMMSGGAVEQACRAVRAQLIGHVAHATRCYRTVSSTSSTVGIRTLDGSVDIAVADAAPGEVFEATEEFHHQVT